MITQVRGLVRSVNDEVLTLAIEPFELEVMIPEYVRRAMQQRVGELVLLHTEFFLDGGQMSGRMTPRLVGFLSPIDREFFELFCSVDGVGVKKALRAMVRPVRELARAIQDREVKVLATFPGIGDALAERIVAKLRRRVGKFALMVETGGGAAVADGMEPTNGEAAHADSDVIHTTYSALISVGHTDSQARELIDQVLRTKKTYRSVADMIDAIYKLREG